MFSLDSERKIKELLLLLESTFGNWIAIKKVKNTKEGDDIF